MTNEPPYFTSAPASSAPPDSVPFTSVSLNRKRRLLLGGLLTGYTASLIPWALAQPVENDQQGAFIALSAILVGRESLDTHLGQRLYRALVGVDAGFPAAASSLLALVNQGRIDPMTLQATLDGAHPELAALPRQIVTAWYVGVVGDGANARCLAYEDSLMNEVVKDKLVPPTYAYGAYGSWEHEPR